MQVKKEVFPVPIVLDKLFASGVFQVSEPTDEPFLTRLLSTHGLHFADAEVLALAHEHAGIAVMDDEVGRKTAKVYDIAYVGSSYVLMRAVREGLFRKLKLKKPSTIWFLWDGGVTLRVT